MSDSYDVKFRYIGIRCTKGDIPCICLCYDSRQRAELAFGALHDYVKSCRPDKGLRVEFIKHANSTYSLSIDSYGFSVTAFTYISGIDPLWVHTIITQLRIFRYYIIIAGYEMAEELSILPLRDFHLFRSELIVDGKRILGNTRCEFQWATLLD
jgi:hypothetical protein